MNRTRTRPHDSLRRRGADATVAILRTADIVRARIAALVEPAGVTVQQYNVLRILRGAHPEPLPTLEIGERLIERTPGITGLLDRLAAKQLVWRARSTEDRRLVHCGITEAGLTLLAGLDRQADELDEAVARSLDPKELDAMLRMLERVRQGRT